jgi:hypothetical protein
VKWEAHPTDSGPNRFTPHNLSRISGMGIRRGIDACNVRAVSYLTQHEFPETGATLYFCSARKSSPSPFGISLHRQFRFSFYLSHEFILFNGGVSSSDYTASNEEIKRIMNWKGCERERPWPIYGWFHYSQQEPALNLAAAIPFRTPLSSLSSLMCFILLCYVHKIFINKSFH